MFTVNKIERKLSVHAWALTWSDPLNEEETMRTQILIGQGRIIGVGRIVGQLRWTPAFREYSGNMRTVADPTQPLPAMNWYNPATIDMMVNQYCPVMTDRQRDAYEHFKDRVVGVGTIPGKLWHEKVPVIKFNPEGVDIYEAIDAEGYTHRIRADTLIMFYNPVDC